jgi:hypothetical protein
MSIFEGHPLLLVLLGFLAPLLIRQPRFSSIRREWWLLPLLTLVCLGLDWLLAKLPIVLDPYRHGVDLSFLLIASLLPFALLNRILAGRDREMLELLLSIPLLVFWGMAPKMTGITLPVTPVLLAPLSAIVFLLLLTGMQEKFRRNRAPASVTGLPFRLLATGAILFLLIAMQTALAGRLP